MSKRNAFLVFVVSLAFTNYSIPMDQASSSKPADARAMDDNFAALDSDFIFSMLREDCELMLFGPSREEESARRQQKVVVSRANRAPSYMQYDDSYSGGDVYTDNSLKIREYRGIIDRAFQTGDIKVFEQFDINLQDKLGNTALHGALWHNDLKMLAFLMRISSLKPNILNKHRSSALELGVCQKHWDAVKMLLKVNGIDVNAGKPVLQWPIVSEDEEGCSILERAGAVATEENLGWMGHHLQWYMARKKGIESKL